MYLAGITWSAAAENGPGSGAVGESEVLAVMQKPGRLPADIERDRRSQPQLVIPLLKLEPGDTVVDINGGGGYYSELLAGVLGESGEAILHNTPGFEAWGINGLRDRFTGRDPGNITRLTINEPELGLRDGELDGAIIVMAFHDLYVVPKRYNGEEYVRVGDPADVGYFLDQVLRALKPGGRLVVVDHAGHPDQGVEENAELHRIEERFARTEIETRGFRSIGDSDALRNPQDERTAIVFDEAIQGRTDRFVLVFEKPAE
jgi:predicted methyltransferase